LRAIVWKSARGLDGFNLPRSYYIKSLTIPGCGFYISQGNLFSSQLALPSMPDLDPSGDKH
jgi:hypothetical protein